MFEIKVARLPWIYYLLAHGLILNVDGLIIISPLNLWLKLLGLVIVQGYVYCCLQQIGILNSTKKIISLRHRAGTSWVLGLPDKQISATVCNHSVITSQVLILIFTTKMGKYRCILSAARQDPGQYRKLCVLLLAQKSSSPSP